MRAAFVRKLLTATVTSTTIGSIWPGCGARHAVVLGPLLGKHVEANRSGFSTRCPEPNTSASTGIF